jgi:uncharacterized protein YcbK (DUF882 family)
MSSRRRDFLRQAAASLLAGLPAAAARTATAQHRRLVLLNTHTRETLDSTYWRDGRHLPTELGRLDWVFRDHRTGSVTPIDVRLFDLLHELARDAGVEARYQIISGYRTPATNAMLAARSDGVSQRSLHMAGRAIDVRLEGVALASFRDLALAKRAGGVGFYSRSNFLHLDVGRVRSWSG